MRTSHTEAFHLTGQRAKHLRPLLDFEAVSAKPLQLLMFLRYGGRVNDETRLGLPTGMRNAVDAFFIVDEHAFLLQLACQLSGCLVVACHDKATLDEVTGNGTHTNASSTYKIDCSDIFCFHLSFC